MNAFRVVAAGAVLSALTGCATTAMYPYNTSGYASDYYAATGFPEYPYAGFYSYETIPFVFERNHPRHHHRPNAERRHVPDVPQPGTAPVAPAQPRGNAPPQTGMQPHVIAPNVNLPQISAPAINTPTINVPQMSVPSIRLPQVNGPRFSLPGTGSPGGVVSRGGGGGGGGNRSAGGGHIRLHD